MPHIVVKLMEGRSETQKQRLAALITEAVMAGAGCSEEAVSVAIEDIAAGTWTEAVYRPDIEPRLDRLYKTPGYAVD